MKKYFYLIARFGTLLFYLLFLYQVWHLFQYGSLRSHLLRIWVCGAGLLFFLIVRLCLRRERFDAIRRRRFRRAVLILEIVILVAGALGFGIKTAESATPFQGALSWQVYDRTHKTEISLEHGNLFEDGIDGVLEDLDKKLDLPEELYLSGKFQLLFDEDGEILTLDAFLYGESEKGEKKTYLITYDAEESGEMTVWKDGNVNAGYEEEYLLAPMQTILNSCDWRERVEESSMLLPGRTYKLVYAGRADEMSGENLYPVPEDSPVGAAVLNQLGSGGMVSGYELILDLPDPEDGAETVSVKYMLDPVFTSAVQIQEEKRGEEQEEAKAASGWYKGEDGTMYYYLDEGTGWSLNVIDAALGSRLYDIRRWNGMMWQTINSDPFSGQYGVAEGLMFYDEDWGVALLGNASSSRSGLYITWDGGVTFSRADFPETSVTELPASAEELGFSLEDYDYAGMPTREGDTLTVLVRTEAQERDGILYTSYDRGLTWEYSGVSEQ